MYASKRAGKDRVMGVPVVHPDLESVETVDARARGTSA